MNNISDESVIDIDKRNYYIQSYDFTMLGYLIDEEEFEVKPAISRVVQLFEVDTQVPKGKRAEITPSNPDEFVYNLFFTSGNTSIIDDKVDYRINLTLVGTSNVTSGATINDGYRVYINDDFYGVNVNFIQLNTGDLLRVDITKKTPGEEANIEFQAKLV
jgi:hypothetical protein